MRHYAGSALMLIVTMAAAVGCYTINLRVSGERAAVQSLRNQLVADARDMRNLQAELRTRARFPEMQRWNDSVFQMSAPAAGQFLRSPVQLASYGAARAPAQAKPDVVYAVTAPATLAPPSATVVQAAYRPAVQPAAQPGAPVPEVARLIRAGYTVAPRGASLDSVAPAPTLTVPVAPDHAATPAVQRSVAAAASRAAAPADARASAPVASRATAQATSRAAAPATTRAATASAPASAIRIAMLDAPHSAAASTPRSVRPAAARHAAPAPTVKPDAAPEAGGGPIDLLAQGGQ
jgi:hypothetical protein